MGLSCSFKTLQIEKFVKNTASGRGVVRLSCVHLSTLVSLASSVSHLPLGGENCSPHSSSLINPLGASLEIEAQPFDKIHSSLYREFIRFSESLLLGQLPLKFSFPSFPSKITKVVFVILIIQTEKRIKK